jgi:autophagy-related protein 17
MPDNPLLQWTLDAKRALQQAEQLSSHASNLVTDSSSNLDRADSLIPKCIFLKEALKGQIGILERLGGGCYAVEERARREFEVLALCGGVLMKVFIKELDSLDIELNEILSRLKNVSLDPGFDVVNGVEGRQNPPRTSLHDFVDEQGIEELKTQLRQAIDEVQV